jgi:hypothetical protein
MMNAQRWGFWCWWRVRWWRGSTIIWSWQRRSTHRVYSITRWPSNNHRTNWKRNLRWCRKWKKYIEWHRKIFVPNTIVFQELLQEKHAVSTPISYFKKYFTAELFEDFSKMTNIYALQNNVVFKPTDVMEIRQLLDLHMHMGFNKLPRLRMYWSFRKVSKNINNVF